MRFEIVDDKSKWDAQLSLIRQVNKDIYFSYDYYHLYEVNGDGQAKAALYSGDNGMQVVYPFILKPVKGYRTQTQYFDIESAYGYGGPAVEDYNESDMKVFEDLFHGWCMDNNIVAEFVRFHPFLYNYKYFNADILIERNRTTVYIDLEKGIYNIWNISISSKNRNMIRKAQREGIEVRISSNYPDFIRLYQLTMDKLGADGYFYFSDNYYRDMIELDGRFSFLAEAVYDGKAIASAVFLYSEEYLHYHLSGSDPEYLKLAPNNILLFKAIEYGCEKGLKKFHLGGGTTNKVDDRLYRFKRSFSKDESTFYTGKRIHNRDKYLFFINEWKKKTGKEPKLFLQYEY